jgi:hypothetical protein
MRRAALIIALLAFAWSSVWAKEKGEKGEPDLKATLDRVAEYVQSYFTRAQSIIADETIRIQPLGFDLLSDGLARTLRTELRISWEPDADGTLAPPQVLRTLISVNGRPPREKDNDRCFDPQATSPEILSLFLPENQKELDFKANGHGKVGGREAQIIDVHEREKGPATVTRTYEGCSRIEKPGSAWYRTWIDVETFAVLRLDQHLEGPYDVTIPADRKLGTMSRDVMIERLDASITYRPVTFTDPQETVMLPVSREMVQVIRNAPSPRMRISHSYRNFRRFMTGGRIVQQ